jgi:hypothetical protein
MSGFDTLRAKEQHAIGTEFVAPSNAGFVFVCPAGVTYTVRVRGSGWGVFRLDSATEASRLRDASADDVLRYSEHGRFSAVLVHQLAPDAWLAWAGKGIIIRLCPDTARRYDTVLAVRAGEYWFVSVDPSADPAVTLYLQDLGDDYAGTVACRGLTPVQREAWEFAGAYRKQATPSLEVKLRKQLSYGGGEYLSHTVGAENIVIEFLVDGRRHISTISTKFVGVSWGFCLSNQDNRFNLAGMPSVIRGKTRRYDYEDD